MVIVAITCFDGVWLIMFVRFSFSTGVLWVWQHMRLVGFVYWLGAWRVFSGSYVLLDCSWLGVICFMELLVDYFSVVCDFVCCDW